MAFTDRISEHPNRVVLTEVSGQANTYDIDFESAQGTISQEGTSLNATEMNDAVNDLIASAFNGVNITSGGSIKARNIQGGVVSVTPTSANAVNSQSFTFDQPFENTPIVVLTPRTTVPNTITCGVSNVSTTGFTLYMTRTNTTTTNFFYLAIGL